MRVQSFASSPVSCCQKESNRAIHIGFPPPPPPPPHTHTHTPGARRFFVLTIHREHGFVFFDIFIQCSKIFFKQRSALFNACHTKDPKMNVSPRQLFWFTKHDHLEKYLKRYSHCPIALSNSSKKFTYRWPSRITRSCFHRVSASGHGSTLS